VLSVDGWYHVILKSVRELRRWNVQTTSSLCIHVLWVYSAGGATLKRLEPLSCHVELLWPVPAEKPQEVWPKDLSIESITFGEICYQQGLVSYPLTQVKVSTGRLRKIYRHSRSNQGWTVVFWRAGDSGEEMFNRCWTAANCFHRSRLLCGFTVFMAVRIKIIFLWDVTPFSLVDRYQRFR
jgi:hypothetical protein